MAGVSLSGIAFRPECTWKPKTLVFADLLWAWSDKKKPDRTLYHHMQDYHQSPWRTTGTGWLTT